MENGARPLKVSKASANGDDPVLPGRWRFMKARGSTRHIRSSEPMASLYFPCEERGPQGARRTSLEARGAADEYCISGEAEAHVALDRPEN